MAEEKTKVGGIKKVAKPTSVKKKTPKEYTLQEFFAIHNATPSGIKTHCVHTFKNIEKLNEMSWILKIQKETGYKIELVAQKINA